MKIISIRRRIPEIAATVAFGLLLTVSLVLAQAERIPGSYITTTTVNVRRGPGTNYEIVTKIPAGIRVQVVGREGDWLRVESKHGRPPGYISARFTRPAEGQAGNIPPVSGTYATTADVKVRSGPGLSYEVVATIPRDTEVQVVGAEGDWLKVQSKHGNPPGYIERRFARPR